MVCEMKFILWFIFTIILFGDVIAQNTITLKGVVKDKEGTPISGVTVRINNTAKGMATDINGAFHFKPYTRRVNLFLAI